MTAWLLAAAAPWSCGGVEILAWVTHDGGAVASDDGSIGLGDGAAGQGESSVSSDAGPETPDDSATRQEGGSTAQDAATFGPPTLVSELAAANSNDFKETLTDDLLEVYFCSDRPGGPGEQDIWFSTRTTASDPWSTPACAVDLSGPTQETGTALAGDGLTIWFSSDRPGGKGGYDIWVSTRVSRTTAWSTPKPVMELNTPSDEFPRPPIASGLLMPPSYRSAPINQFQTFTTTRPSPDSPWTAPVRLTEVDTADVDTDGFETSDGLAFYFSSDRIVDGGQNLFVATRADAAAPFGSFAPLAELNVLGAQDRDPWLSPDGHEIYFSSNRSGTLKIYEANR